MSCQYCTSCGAPTEPLPSGPEAPSAVPLPEAPAQGAAPSSLPPALCSPEEPVVPHPAAPAQGASVQEQAPPAKSKYAPISVGSWIGILLLLALPGVNLILLIVWACGGCRKMVKRSFARASLLLVAVFLVLGLISGIVLRLATGPHLKTDRPGDPFWSTAGGLLSGKSPQGDTASSPLWQAFLSQAEEPAPDAPSGPSEEGDSQSSESTEDSALLDALLSGNRDALREQGYTDEEIDQAISLFGEEGLSALFGAFSRCSFSSLFS